MQNQDPEFWKELFRLVGRESTPEEIDAELDSIEGEQVSAEDRKSVIDLAMAGGINFEKRRKPDLSWAEEGVESEDSERLAALHRNPGESNAEMEDKLKRLREKLEDSVDEEDDDDLG